VAILTLTAIHAMAQTMPTVQTERLISLQAAEATQSAFTFEKGFSFFSETSFLDHNNITSNSFNQTSHPPLTISPQNVSLYRDSIGTIHIVGVLINPFTFPIAPTMPIIS